MFRLVIPVALFMMFNAVTCCTPHGGGSAAGSHNLPGLAPPPPGQDGLYGPPAQGRDDRPGPRGPSSMQTDQSTAEFRQLLTSSSNADRIFSNLDKPDGYVTLSEWVSEGGDPATYRYLLTRIDENDDGKLALSEVKGSWSELLGLLRGLTEPEIRDGPPKRYFDPTRGIPSNPRDRVPDRDPAGRFPERGLP